ncbi:MAG: aspartate-semialdehyde dehydrogenase [Acidobacteria bacterium]|nr:MAG: aspartate-semialdehyde dehydrogenase [Acidobacteriota bacterium]REK04151.1 MAG: aspartate-semialdehyde dehydrogenase [Acidobacteriota bacterium]REK15313.1 MAG: aspartate-semialdehyde dehydrogenase [Acidobacteriota bacterium]REK46403.1 MAG: aspartate-semialdehyde dehydrogenase [Acidobacteriota bacterium]
MSKYRVGILGATGTVGQRFCQLLENHPQFEITALAASDRSVGKAFSEACPWKLKTPMPASVSEMEVAPITPSLDCDIIFSSLPSGVARETEETFARAGYPVISNSSCYRMEEDVPLLIPEINPEHLALIDVQRRKRGFDRGFIITNPNCAVMSFAPPLAALDRKFGVKEAIITTFQAVSGAGYPGVASLDILDNVLPYIPGEEPKAETEAQKIIGKFSDGSIEKADFTVSAHCFRVNVVDGHTASVRVNLNETSTLEDVIDAMRSFPSAGLHSSPENFIEVREEPSRPQPRLDRNNGNGMSITVGRLFPDNIFDYSFVALSHNTIRGAAGAAILNAELLVEKGIV